MPAVVHELEQQDAAMKSYFKLLRSDPSEQELIRQRPKTLFVPQSGFQPEARGTVWDFTGERPKPAS